jgi:hypothetical protein
MGNNPAPIRDVAPNVHSAVVIILQTQRQHTNSPKLILSHACELGFVFGFFVLVSWCRAGEQGMDASSLSQACQLLSCQYWYFCTSKASTFVLVKCLLYYYREHPAADAYLRCEVRQ